MTGTIIFRSSLLVAAIASMFLFTSCDKENNNENIVIKQAELRRQIEFLNADEPAVTPDWGSINQEGGFANWGVLVTDPSKIYPGATYPQPDILNGTFKHELTHEKNFFHLFCSSKPMYIDSASTINNMEIYKAAYQRLVNTKDFMPVDIDDWGGNILEEGAFKTYEELKTHFYGRSDLGKVFIKTAYENAKGLNKVKGRMLLHKFMSYYTIYMDNLQALFKEDRYNHAESYAKDSLPLFAQHISYGKAVWVLVESEYSYNELVEAMFYIKHIDEEGIKANRHIKNIINKTVFTVLSLGNSAGVFCAPVSVEEFKNQYNKRQKIGEFYGLPIFVKWRYVHNGGSLNEYI